MSLMKRAREEEARQRRSLAIHSLFSRWVFVADADDDEFLCGRCSEKLRNAIKRRSPEYLLSVAHACFPTKPGCIIVTKS